MTGFRDECSEDDVPSTDSGVDLDNRRVRERDMAEILDDTGYEANSMLAGDDESSSDMSLLGFEQQNEMVERRLAADAAARQGARDSVPAAKRRRKEAGRPPPAAPTLDGTETIASLDESSHRGSYVTGGGGSAALPAYREDAESLSYDDSEDSDDSESGSGDGPGQVDLNNVSDVPAEAIQRETVQREVKRQFRMFLRQSQVYVYKIGAIVQEQRRSLVVDFQEMAKFCLGLAVLAGETPTVALGLFNEVATREVLRSYPAYAKVYPDILVRLVNLPMPDAIRNLRVIHMNMLCMVHGVVTRRSLVYPQLLAVKFDCLSCGYVIGPVTQTGSQEAKPKQCPACQKPGPFRINSRETKYRNYQTCILQETPGTVPPGRLPRWIEVILTEDLVDIAKPGDEVQVTGIFQNHFDPLLNHRQGFPVFTTILQANAVQLRKDQLSETINEADKKEILALAQHPNIVDKILASVCPSIHGNEMEKAGIACSLFGGVAKEVNAGKHRMRGDVNVLLVGDPGCAKSQFLKYIEKTSPRAVFTTGKGSTAVGLTAAVHRDAMTGEWTLEGGAMVIADRGHCLIDEFDKMGDQDRTSIHEAMEQQTISIAKAGIVTSLQARCSIVAAANPIMGHYDSTQTFENQVNLTQPILSRFDLLFAIRDSYDDVRDNLLARFVLNSHMRNHPLTQPGEDIPLLSGVREITEDCDPSTTNPRYILYARSTCKPMLENVNTERLVKFYVELRDDSAMKYESGVKIVVRHLESICRLSEAFAKMRLSAYVREDDVSRAIALFLNAFLTTLQYKRKETLKKKYNGYLVAQKQYFVILDHLLQACVKEQCQIMNLKYGGYDKHEITITVSDFRAQAHEYKIFDRDIDKYLQSDAFTSNYKLDNQTIVWKKFA